MNKIETPKDKPQYPVIVEIENSFKKDCKIMVFDIAKDILKELDK